MVYACVNADRATGGEQGEADGAANPETSNIRISGSSALILWYSWRRPCRQWPVKRSARCWRPRSWASASHRWRPRRPGLQSRAKPETLYVSASSAFALISRLQAVPAVASEAQRKVLEAAQLGECIAQLVAKAAQAAEQSDELEAMAVREKAAAEDASKRAMTTTAELEVRFAGITHIYSQSGKRKMPVYQERGRQGCRGFSGRQQARHVHNCSARRMVHFLRC